MRWRMWSISDAQIGGKLKVVFLENLSVSIGQLIYPAADISEQFPLPEKRPMVI